MTQLRERMEGWRKDGHKAFVAYITAGDPTREATLDVVDTLVKAGVDVVELGVPFSDPVGDGPTNQKAAERALAAGTSLSGVLTMAADIGKRHPTLPIVLFTYFNPVFRMGLAEFAKRARASGVAGVLTVDLPPEEADDYVAALAKENVATVFLASPTTTAVRLKRINELTTGFVYYVSRTGVTGTQSSLSASLGAELEALRKTVTRPLVVGFGISTAEQAREVARRADGVVVGSALVKTIEENVTRKDAMTKAVGELAKKLAEGVHAESRR